MNRGTRIALTLILPVCHFVLCVAIQAELFGSSEGSCMWFPVFVVDAPFSLLLLAAESAFGEWSLPALAVFGLAGTAWWGFLSWAIVSAIHRALEKPAR